MLPKIGQGIGLYEWKQHHESVLRKGIDLGLNYLDTAADYGDGESEKLVGNVIQECRDKVIVGTKFGPQNNSYSDVLKSADQSLLNLKTDYIDLYQLHWLNPDVPLEASLSAMLFLQEQGKIRKIGVGNLSLKELKLACRIAPIFSFQIEYNFFDRSIEKEIMPFCESKGIQIIAYSPLDRGRLCSKRQMSTLNIVAKKYGKDPSQVVLNWIVAQGCTAIPTARQLDHLRKNANSLFDMNPEDVQMLSEPNFSPVQLISPSSIIVSMSGEDSRQTYQTIDEARKNNLGFVPSPEQLALFIRYNRDIKPVRLVKSGQKFTLIEGRIRYWAWMIAFGDEPIPALVRDNFKD